MLQLDSINEAASRRPSAAKHIIIVDDDRGIRTLLARLLQENGYDVSSAEDGAEMEQIMRNRSADLILLDIMLPGQSGFDICRAVRAHSQVPVIMISARGQEVDRVEGLDIGADDYIAKPFGRSEVLARVRAILRRAGEHGAHLSTPVPQVFEFAGWSYRPRQRALISPAGADVELTAAEHELLFAFLQNPQRTIGRERLLELSRARLAHSSDRSIDVLISRLRRKLGDRERDRPMIRTARGVGYILAVDVVIQ